MANTAEGLEQVSNGEQVNSEAGFAAALAAKGVEPDKSTASDTSVAGGLETVEPAQARDPGTGRFVAKEAAAPAQDTSQGQGADTSTGEQFTSDDPAVAAFLAKYDGNLEEAIKGAANAQALIGRRDEEREQMARDLAEMKGRLDGLTAGQQGQQQAQFLSDEEVEERVTNRIASQGYLGAAKEAAEWHTASGDDRPLRAIFDMWNVEDPWAATNFIADHRASQAVAKVQQAAPAAQGADPYVEDLKAKDAMTQSFAALKGKIGEEQFAALTAVGQDGESPLTRALATMPQPVVELVTADDAATRLSGLELVYDRARAGGLVSAPTPAATQEQGMPDSVRRKLLGAGVATAGLRPAPAAQDGGSGTQTKEQALAAFKSAIVEAETTSVASGLTYGPQGK